jgi:hypothetical protein
VEGEDGTQYQQWAPKPERAGIADGIRQHEDCAADQKDPDVRDDAARGEDAANELSSKKPPL